MKKIWIATVLTRRVMRLRHLPMWAAWRCAYGLAKQGVPARWGKRGVFSWELGER